VNPVVGRDFAEAMGILWPEDVAAYVVKEFRHTLNTGEPFYSRDYIHPRADIAGVESYEWELHRFTLPDASYGVVCYYYDSTNLRNAEQALRRSEGQLQAELADAKLLQGVSGQMIQEANVEALYEQILDAAVAIMRSDFASMQMLYSERGSGGELRLLAQRGFPIQCAKFWEWVEADSSSSCGMALKTQRRAVVPDTEQCDYMAGTSDLTSYRQAGMRAVQSTPLVSRSGKLLGMISTHWCQPHQPAERDLRLLDILARQAADLIERRAAEEALKDADRRKDEFLAMLAHELRNPLAAIRNAGQVLLRTDGDALTRREATDILNRQVAHMARQVDDLLDVSRVSRGQIELRKERTELTAVVNHAIDVNRPLCETMGHELTVTLPPNPLYVLGDPIRLGQVMGNLLNNACKFTEKRGRILLSVEQEAAQAVIRVRDTGIGIATAELPRIFEMFAQVDRSLERTRDGLGLGLTLVKNLVELHNGAVEANSAGLGHGSEFVVRLPLLAGSLPAEMREPSGSQPLAVVPRRVLIVDDNRDAAKGLALLLRLMGHDVDTAHDGLQAVERATTFQADAILLDIGMPRLNGYEAARRIREQRQNGLLLVALTGWGKDEDRRLSEEAGFDAHLVKPVDLAALEKLLAETDAG
jgi:signal transduction histidine kinase